MAKPKWMGYVDPLVKIVGGIVLATATFLLNTSNDIEKKSNDLKQQEINNSLKFGEFTQLLIQDLIAKDSTHFRSDIAFITLDHTIGDKSPGLLTDLGVRMVENYYENRVPSNSGTMLRILAIIEKRDMLPGKPVKASVDRYRAEKEKELYKESQAKATSKDTVSGAAGLSNKSWEKLTLTPARATVFIQVNNSPDALDTANPLQTKLNGKGFNAPGIEKIKAFSFGNSIKYFYDADKNSATQVAAYVKEVLGLTIKPQKQEIEGKKIRLGLIEVWANVK